MGFAMTLPVAASAMGRTERQAVPIVAAVADRHLRYGQLAVVQGRLTDGVPGQRVALQFRPHGGVWGTMASVATQSEGQFLFAATPLASGEVRVVRSDGAAYVSAAAATPEVATPPSSVAVAPALNARRRHVNVLAGRRALVAGQVLPGDAGRVVLLQRRGHAGWQTVARDHTSMGGRFRMRFRPRRPGSALLRVRSASDGVLAAGRRVVGRMNVYRPALVSWYGPGFYGGPLACGGTLSRRTLGVAHKTLPCGTKVTLRYHGRMVRVSVIDRGPYVAGREYDLTAATKERLGFGSLGIVLATV
jgi:hypothetical protein